jgi:hypothetical protein
LLVRTKASTEDIPLADWRAGGQPVPSTQYSVLSAGNCRSPAVNIRPFLRDLRLLPREGSPAEHVLEIDLWLTPAGTARPVEILGLLGLTDLLKAGAVVERSRLELHDEPTNDQ